MAILMQEIWNFCLQRSDIHYNLILCFNYREQMIRPAKSYDSTSSFHVPLSRVQASPHSKQLASVHDCQNWTCTAVELLVALHSCKKISQFHVVSIWQILSAAQEDCWQIIIIQKSGIKGMKYGFWNCFFFFHICKYLEKQV